MVRTNYDRAHQDYEIVSAVHTKNTLDAKETHL